MALSGAVCKYMYATLVGGLCGSNSENPATVEMRDSLSRVQGHLAFCQERTVFLATIVEWTVNQNCCFPKQVRCQIIINFTVHIVTVFSAQISGAARVARYVLVGGRGVGNETGRWKKNHRKLFNKAAAKALFCLAPVFKCKWFFLDLKIKIKLFPRQKFKNRPASTSLPPLCTRPKRKR